MYYRYSSYRYAWQERFTQAVRWLLISNAVVFLLQHLLGFAWMNYRFGLVPVLIRENFMFWQFVTYMFLHGDIFHFLFNMFTLWMFGCEIERQWGTRQFLKYYFLTGVGAGVITFLLTFNSPIPTIGASGSLFGVLVAYALMFPDRPIYLYFLFPIKAKYLVIFFGAVELLASFNHTSDGIGHFTHLGGMLIGYLYLKLDWRWARLMNFIKSFSRQRRSARLRRQIEKEQAILARVDAILDKINQVGIENLTKEEKKLLEQASHLLHETRPG